MCWPKISCGDFKHAARIEALKPIRSVDPGIIIKLQHPLQKYGYDFDVPLLEGEHVTDDAGTGFVHTAPSHGADDFEIWTASTRRLRELGIDATVPDMVGPDGYYRKHVPLFGGEEPKRIIDDKGHFGKLDDMRYANAAVIAALKEAGALAAMNPRHKHDYAHSWRSKAPIIYRNTPQWFIAMDKPNATKAAKNATLRDAALASIDETRFVPPQGRNRLRGMIEQRPDWVISRQRAWGVPITVFVHKETGEVIPNDEIQRLEGAAKAHLRCLQGRGRGRLVRGRRRARVSWTALSTTRPSGSRCAIFSTCGSTPAPPMPSCWKSAKT